MTTPPFEDNPPAGEIVTTYDERHFVTYLRVLDAEAEGADWREIATIVFGLNPSVEPERAKRVYESHLDRARWMTTHGYRNLLEKSRKA
ncbi:MAG: DUF2285 domain-containing protein [Betaproteobacteria bacterium]|nr:DUF2285 domain-containing protein [Betaproteobacteria bacterium]